MRPRFRRRRSAADAQPHIVDGRRPVLVAVGDPDDALLRRIESRFTGAVDVVRVVDGEHLAGVPGHEVAVHLFVDHTLRGSLRAPFDDDDVVGLLQRSGAFAPVAFPDPDPAAGGPLHGAAVLLGRTEDPVAAVAVVVAHLVRSGRVTVDDLQRLGIDATVARSVLEEFDRNDTLPGLGRALAVAATVRTWRTQLADIFAVDGIDDPVDRDALTLSLLTFACANELDDLHLAYRLWSVGDTTTPE